MIRIHILGDTGRDEESRLCDYIRHDDGTEEIEIKNVKRGKIPLDRMMQQIESARNLS